MYGWNNGFNRGMGGMTGGYSPTMPPASYGMGNPISQGYTNGGVAPGTYPSVDFTSMLPRLMEMFASMPRQSAGGAGAYPGFVRGTLGTGNYPGNSASGGSSFMDELLRRMQAGNITPMGRNVQY